MSVLNDEQVVEFVEGVLEDAIDLNDPEEAIAVLTYLDEAYHNDELEIIPDATYDPFRLIIKSVFPDAPYFATVGAQVRGGKIDLPHQLGSLNQVEVGGLAEWKTKVRRALGKASGTSVPLIITAKLDGASALGRFAEGLKIAYSRGDGYKGADITRHVQHFVPKAPGLNGWVRGENIIGKKKFEVDVQPNFFRSGGQQYKNPRNAVSGMMNASAHKDPAVYNYIDFVAYEVLGRNDISKSEMIHVLQDNGFLVPQIWISDLSSLTEEYLAACIQELRDTYGYEVDGVVVDIDSAEHRLLLNDGSLNPEYAFKYKTLDASNYAETEVLSVEWNISKSGYEKPRVNYKPCSLPGITSTYATGYNAKFVKDNNIGPGTIVGVSRMGEVVPNIVRIVKSTVAQMPANAWHWNATGVDAVSDAADTNPEVFIMQLVHAVNKTHMNFPHLGEGAIREIVAYTGAESFDQAMSEILTIDEADWVDACGENGKKIFAGIAAKVKDMDVVTFVGSMPHFGRGIGIRKLKPVFEMCDNLIGFKLLEMSDIVKLPKFDDVTAEKIIGGIDKFFAFYDQLTFPPKFKVSAVTGDVVKGLSICGTGFRDDKFDGWIEANGGKVASSVSGTTNILVAKDPLSNSGKVKKANDINASGKGKVAIMSLQEFNTKYGR